MNRITLNDVVYIKGNKLDANGVVVGGTLQVDTYYNNYRLEPSWLMESGVVTCFAVWSIDTTVNNRHFALVYDNVNKTLKFVNEVYLGTNPYFNFMSPSAGDYTKISYKNSSGASDVNQLGNPPETINADGLEIVRGAGGLEETAYGVIKLVTPFPIFAIDDFQGVYNYFTNGDDSSKIVEEAPSVEWTLVVDDTSKMCKATPNLNTNKPITSRIDKVGFYARSLVGVISDIDFIREVTSNRGNSDIFISLLDTDSKIRYHFIKVTTDATGPNIDFHFSKYVILSDLEGYIGLCDDIPDSGSFTYQTNDDIFPNKINYIIGNVDENSNPDDGKDIDDEDTADFPKDDVDDLPFASHTILTQTYVLPKPQIDALGVALWDTNFFEALIKNANYPLDNIVSCKLFPLNIGHGDANQLKIGNVDMGFQANKLSNRQVYKSNVLHYSPIFTKRKFLNYEPYSNYMMYLPFVGTVNIGSQFLVDRDIQICWIVDFVTGDLTTIVLSDGRTRYTFNSQVAVDIPLSASNRSQIEANTLKQSVGNLIGGNVGGAVSTAVSGLLSGETSSCTPPSSSNALCMAMTPYIIAERVQYVDSDGYDKTYGVPLREYWQLGYLEGFTQCQNVHLEKCSATSEEKAMIETLLEQGVYL